MITFIFGDSITQGYWDSQGGWADRLKARYLTKDIQNGFKYYHGVHNLGVDGNTTAQVLERIRNEVEARLWPNSEYAFVFAIGTNDTVFTDNGGNISSPEQYQDQLTQLVAIAYEYTTKLAFVSLLPVNETLTNPLPNSSSGKRFTNERIELFNNVLEAFCQSNNITFIDVSSKYLAESSEQLLPDGLHPNDAGHQIIYESVASIMDTWLYP